MSLPEIDGTLITRLEIFFQMVEKFIDDSDNCHQFFIIETY